MRKVILLGTLGIMLAVMSGCTSCPDEVKTTKSTRTVTEKQELIIE